MKLRELISEAPGTFSKYRSLGQQPLQLAKHVVGSSTSAVTGAAPAPQTSTRKNPELAVTIDKVIAGKPLDSIDMQNLKKFRTTI